MCRHRGRRRRRGRAITHPSRIAPGGRRTTTCCRGAPAAASGVRRGAGGSAPGRGAPACRVLGGARLPLVRGARRPPGVRGFIRRGRCRGHGLRVRRARRHDERALELVDHRSTPRRGGHGPAGLSSCRDGRLAVGRSTRSVGAAPRSGRGRWARMPIRSVRDHAGATRPVALEQRRETAPRSRPTKRRWR